MMKAARIHDFGPPSVIAIDEVERPLPGPNQVLVRVKAAGVGPWDALIREKKSVVTVKLPLTLGSDLAGTIVALGPEVSGFQIGDEVYGITNPQFIGAYAEFALASASMIAHKPKKLSFVEAASVPVVAVTAWQMLFEYAEQTPGQSVLVLGGAGNVGAYAVQLAKRAGFKTYATASLKDREYVQSLGADSVVDARTEPFEERLARIDLVVDTVGGDVRRRSLKVLKRGGYLVSAHSPLSKEETPPEIRFAFFLVEVTTERLDLLASLLDQGELQVQVGSVLSLQDAKLAHEMLAGAPHKRGKIVLQLQD